MIRFSLCHATARLPLGWLKSAQAWLEACDCPDEVEHILVANDNSAYKLIRGPEYPVFRRSDLSVVTNSRGGVDQWNRAAQLSQGAVILQIADDLFPCPHWDSLLLKAFPSVKDPWVLDVDNSDNSAPLIPHAIMTRPYYERFGYIAHPQYRHLMADVEFTDVARASGCVVDARHLKFRHLNPEAGTVAWDEVYRRHRNPEALEVDRRTFEARKRVGFPTAGTNGFDFFNAESRRAFSLIQPTFRKLPEGWRRAAENWCNYCAAPENVEHILVTHEAVDLGHRVFPNTKYVVNPVAGSVPSWNAGAKAATGDILIAMADDLMSCPHWDESLGLFAPDASKVFEVDHEDQDQLLTHPFVTRAYYERFGYLFHPDYNHLMADVEFTAVARASGQLVNARQLHFPHLGPLHPKARRPATADHDQEFVEAQQLFFRRKAAGFPTASILAEAQC